MRQSGSSQSLSPSGAAAPSSVERSKRQAAGLSSICRACPLGPLVLCWPAWPSHLLALHTTFVLVQTVPPWNVSSAPPPPSASAMSRATTLLNRSRTRPLCLCSPCLLRCAPVSRVAKGPSRPWNGARGFQCTSRRPDQRAGGGAHEQPLASLRKAASSTDAAHDILSDVAFAFECVRPAPRFWL